MRQINIALTVMVLGILVATTNAHACLMESTYATEQALKNLPAKASAFKGEILKVDPDTDAKLQPLPNEGVHADFKIVSVVRGSLREGEIVSVDFGPCHGLLPGKVGDVIPVIVYKGNSNSWYAPQFPN